jgi:hypothetical protein
MSGPGSGLHGRKGGTAIASEREQLIEQCAIERLALCCALNLDEAAITGHYDVHVGLSAHVIVVVKIKTRLAVDVARAAEQGILWQVVAIEALLEDACASPNTRPHWAIAASAKLVPL